MKKSWFVHLIYPPLNYTYRPKFFPRKFHYKKDAEALKEEVERLGGVARVSDKATRP